MRLPFTSARDDAPPPPYTPNQAELPVRPADQGLSLEDMEVDEAVVDAAAVADDDSAAYPAHPRPDLEIHPFPSCDGLLVRVMPPREPTGAALAAANGEHVPCEIVLVLDVSGSMVAAAPPPVVDGVKPEDAGMCTLDLVKHAACTVLETLNAGDCLGLVSFDTKANVLMPLLPMTPENKALAKGQILGMETAGATNLWRGLVEGLNLFSSEERASSSPDAGKEKSEKSKQSDSKVAADTGRVPALMLLTDGMPNTQCPAQGYIPKLVMMRHTLPPATIHTFGFGYQLRSGLLKAIADFGHGNYAFIPDSGMIGTVFVHAVANLQATYADRAVLELTAPAGLRLRDATGIALDIARMSLEAERGEDGENKKNKKKKLGGWFGGAAAASAAVDSPPSSAVLRIPLGNLQYGQTRDIVLDMDAAAATAASQGDNTIHAVLKYAHFQPGTRVVAASRRAADASTTLPPIEMAYHRSRAAVIKFLTDLFPIWMPTVEYRVRARSTEDTDDARAALAVLVASLPANKPEFLNLDDDDDNVASGRACRSLLDDLDGAEPYGQVRAALADRASYARWGVHYLPSLAGAHARQVCNSFRDPGPLAYGAAASALFARCRDRLDAAFDELEPPEPTLPRLEKERAAAMAASMQMPAGRFASMNSSSFGCATHTTSYSAKPKSMGGWRDIRGTCFAAGHRVVLAGSGGRTAADGDNIVEGSGVTSAQASMPVEQLRPGDAVHTPRGPRRVQVLVKTRVEAAELAVLAGGLEVTPWHPVSLPRERSGAAAVAEKKARARLSPWEFPANRPETTTRTYTGYIYSVLLERDADPDAHAICIGGVWAATLGHGLVGREGEEKEEDTAQPDVRRHGFFGDWDAVAQAVAELPEEEDTGTRLSGGVVRETEGEGLICGFKSPDGPMKV